MFVVDASVWVARFVLADAHHRTSLAWLSAQIDADESLIMPSAALPEVAGAIARRTGFDGDALNAIEAIRRLPNTTLVDIDTPLAERASKIATHQRLRGADALYVVVAYEIGVPLITWDREQRLRGSAIVTTAEPS